MAKPRTTRTTRQPSPEPDELVEMIESGDQLRERLSEIAARAGTSTEEFEAMAHVYIVQPDGDEKIWKGDPSEYDLDKLAHQHGTNTYRLKVYVKDETNQFRLRLNQEFKYRLSPAEDARLRLIKEGKAAPAAEGGNGATGFSLEQLGAYVDQRVRAAAPAPVDPFAGAERVVGMFAKLMPQQNASAAPQGLGLRDALELAKSLASLSQPATAERSKPADLAVNRGIDLVTRMFEKSIEGRAALPNPSPAASAEQQLSAEEKDALEDLRLALRMACRAAKAGTPAAEFVDSYYDQIPIETVAQLYSDPQWFDVFCANVPECAQQKPWFESARAALIAEAQKAGELTADGRIVENPPDGVVDAGTGTVQQ